MQKLTDYRSSRELMHPEPVSIIIAKTEDGRYNPMSASWYMPTSIDPVMFVISVGFQRYTYEALEKSREFVLCLPAHDMEKEIRFFGSESGRDMDKLKELGTATQPATHIDCVLLSDASVNYECRVVSTHKTGDHMIFAAELLASHIHAEGKPRLYLTAKGEFKGAVPAP